MAGAIRCGYCQRWSSSPVKSRQENGSAKEKKIIRECDLNAREIDAASTACRYFKPVTYFFCDEYEYWLTFLQCLNRQGKKNADQYPKCFTGCRQFWKELEPICEAFDIDLPKKRIIKRRKATPVKASRRRVIKRRKK